MWTRELLKSNAKQVLARCYWRTFAVCLIAGLLTGGGVGAVLERRFESDSFHGLLGLLIGLAGLLAGVAALAWGIFASNVLTVGWKRYMMESRGGDSPVETLISGFGPGYGNLVKGMFLSRLRIALYTLLLVVPGIIKSYEYLLVPHLLAENPSMQPARAMELSAQMTDGEKWNIFVLQLSFIGWWLLSGITRGLAGLFVSPYYEATMAELYAALRAKAFALELTDSAELGGFVQR